MKQATTAEISPKPFTHRANRLPGIPPGAALAWLELCAGLDDLRAQGRRPPCTSRPEAWDADADDDARAEAARACHWCPVLEPCRRYADLAERVHVWGGVDRAGPTTTEETQ